MAGTNGKKSERLTLSLHDDGSATATSVCDTDTGRKVYKSKRPAVVEVKRPFLDDLREYAYRMLELESLPRSLQVRLAYREVGSFIAYVVDPVLAIGVRKRQPIIPARLGRASTIDFDNDYESLLNRKRDRSGGVITHEIELLEFTRSVGEIRLVFRRSVIEEESLLLECSCCLPIPGSLEPGTLPAHAPVIGQLAQGQFTENTIAWENLVRAFDLVHQKSSAEKGFKVLLNGPPGSGKEVFAHLLHYGGLRPLDAKLKSRSIGGLSTDAVQDQLVGRNVDGGVLVGSLIGDANDDCGTLFLDEVEKVNAPGNNGEQSPRALGGFLLRVLENDEFYPAGSTVPRKAKNLNWIFAGAKLAIGDNINQLPADFQSRIDAEIAIKNPLEVDGQVGPYAAALFLHFFCKEALDSYVLGSKVGRSNVLGRKLLEWTLGSTAGQPMKIGERSGFGPSAQLLEYSQRFGALAAELADVLQISARSIRVVAKSCAIRRRTAGEREGFNNNFPKFDSEQEKLVRRQITEASAPRSKHGARA